MSAPAGKGAARPAPSWLGCAAAFLQWRGIASAIADISFSKTETRVILPKSPKAQPFNV